MSAASVVNTASTPEVLAVEIRREHAAAQGAVRVAVEHAIRCGKLLLRAKEQVAYGGWSTWIDRNFPASQRTAQGYMRLAQRAEETQGLAHLGIEGVLRELATRDLPQPTPDPDDPAAPTLGSRDSEVESGRTREQVPESEVPPEATYGRAGRRPAAKKPPAEEGAAEYLADVHADDALRNLRTQAVSWFEHGGYLALLIEEGEQLVPKSDSDKEALRRDADLMIQVAANLKHVAGDGEEAEGEPAADDQSPAAGPFFTDWSKLLDHFYRGCRHISHTLVPEHESTWEKLPPRIGRP